VKRVDWGFCRESGDGESSSNIIREQGRGVS